MAINTIDDLEDRLDNAISWRRVELSALKSAVEQAESRSPGSPLSRALARSGVAMLYAHWEGFVKEACQAYVDYVAKRRLKCSELNDGLLRTVLLGLHKRALGGDQLANDDLIQIARRPEQTRAKIPRTTIVDTKSNLRYSVLADILCSIGISMDKFATKSHLVDRSLCDVRNSIAHGRDLFPSEGDFSELHHEVIVMIEDLRDLILANARQGLYKAPADPSS
ncbi:MAG TPA: MAE_28990/MAE_18760 family HEPN-like nuclease [Gemmataceae bacterium]|nr:MAE_28990/MAE_18760 family HEPN-like nuclease [Gemmataceae bacterium]